MSQLRKEKEQQLFQQFQSQQQRMADLLLRQRQEERSTEDEAISKAMEEQYAKKEVGTGKVALAQLLPSLLFSKLNWRRNVGLWSRLRRFRNTAFK